MIRYNNLEYKKSDEVMKIVSYAENLVELSFVEDFLDGIEKIKNNDSYTYDFDKLGSGSYATVYSYKGFVLKRNLKTKEDQDIFKEYQMGLHLNKYSIFPKTYALIECDDYYYIIAERVYGLELEDIYNVDMLNPESLKNFENELLAVIKEGIEPRDLHGENVMIDTDGNIKIIDIGYFKSGYEIKEGTSDNRILDMAGTIYKLEDLKKISESVYEFKKTISTKLKKKNLFIERIMSRTYLHEAKRHLSVEEKKELINVFLKYIEGEKYQELKYIGSGTHSEAYILENKNVEYILKVQVSFPEEFYKKQIKIMKNTAPFGSFLENIVYYYDEDRNMFFILQERLKNIVGESKLSENINGSHAKYRLNLFVREMKKLVRKTNILANDTHEDNVAYVNNNGCITLLCFDISYFFDLNSKKAEELMIYFSNSLDDKDFLNDISASYWVDDMREEFENREQVEEM